MRVLLPLLLIVLSGCEVLLNQTVEDQSVRPARVYQVAAEGATITHEFVGRVEAAQTVDVSFEVAGPLVKLPVKEGQTIGAGQLVAALDPTDFKLALREADVQLKLARQDLERKNKLFRERGISESVVDDARALYDLRAVRVLQAREALADTRIVAPFDAYVARRFTDSHVNVRAGDKIARLNDLNELYVVTTCHKVWRRWEPRTILFRSERGLPSSLMNDSIWSFARTPVKPMPWRRLMRSLLHAPTHGLEHIAGYDRNRGAGTEGE